MRVLLVDFNPFMAAVTPISLGYLGAALKRAAHEVSVLSLGSTTRFSPSGFSAMVRELAPDLVGFGAYQRNLVHVRGLAKLVRKVLPRARVILGGPQAMFLPETALPGLPEIDVVCRGDGEQVVVEVADALESGPLEAAMPGASVRLASGEWVTTPRSPSVSDLDLVPSPYLDEVLDPGDWEEAVLLSSRGCPYRCAFCITPAASGGACRQHSVERTLEEITRIAGRGTRRLWFADPNFCCRPSRVVELLEGVAVKGLAVEMWIETRADMVTEELVALMRRSGVTQVAMGLESASPEVCRRLRKGVEPEEVEHATRLLLEAGLQVELFSQFGLPGETLDDAVKTLDFVGRCGVPIRGNSNAQQMQLYFGSEIAASPHSYGVRPLREDLPLHLSVGDQFETEWMSRDELELVRVAWRSRSLDGGKRVVS